MTDKEKVNAYDEVRKKIAIRFGSNVADEIFSQFEMSDDEKIRKALIYHYQGDGCICTNEYRIDYKDIRAWLEKQDNSKNIDCALEFLEDVIKENKEKWQLTNWFFEATLWLIQKVKCMENNDKPIDKIKPKFHEGDWVVSDLDGKARQISEVHFDEYNSYYVVDGKSVNLEEYDRLHHLWTVEDAREGDVLCTYECGKPKIVFILKGTPKKHYALSYHCYYNIMYPCFESDSERGCLAPNDEDVKPATKEQCDTLEMAMTNAGYRWNKEKNLN